MYHINFYFKVVDAKKLSQQNHHITSGTTMERQSNEWKEHILT